MASAAEQRSDRRLASVEQAQRAMPRLLAEVNARPELARAALANPLFAIEELGWSIDEGVRSTFERRIRFTADVAARLDALEAQIGEIAGHHVEVDDPHEVAHLLFDQLKLPVPGAPARRTKQRRPEATIQATLPTAPLPPRLPWSPEPAPDPLVELAGAHPVIAPLLEFRHLDAGAPRLASPEVYRRVRDGDGSIGNVTFHRHEATKPPATKPAATKPTTTKRPAAKRAAARRTKDPS